jgi:hypothetical protein
MQEIQATTVQVKVSDAHPDKHVLVHDGERILTFAEPGDSGGGRVGTHPRHTMLVGTKEELEAEIARLNLEPQNRPPRPPQRPAEPGRPELPEGSPRPEPPGAIPGAGA